MKLIRNKKGEEIVMPETAKIALAVLCILGLIYLAVVLFNAFKSDNQLQQSKAAMEEISSKLSLLQSGEKSSYLYVSPSKWYLVDVSQREALPKECNSLVSKNCFCLCDNADCNKLVTCNTKSFDKPIFLIEDGFNTELSKLVAPIGLNLSLENSGYYIRLEVNK